MAKLSLTVNAPDKGTTIGKIIETGRKHSTAYLIVEAAGTVIGCVGMIRSNLVGYNISHPAHVRPLTGGYGAFFRAASAVAVVGYAATAVQLADRVRDNGEGVYGPITDSNTDLISGVVSNLAVALITLRSAARGRSGKYPLTTPGRVGYLLTATKSAIGAYEHVRELLSRPDVQRALGEAAGYTMGTLARLRDKLPFGNKSGSNPNALLIEEAKRNLEAQLSSEDLSDEERWLLEELLDLANREPELFAQLIAQLANGVPFKE